MKKTDKSTIEKYWNEIIAKVKQQWTKFSENELVKMKKSYHDLKGELEQKYVDKKEETKTAKQNKELNELKAKPKSEEDKKKGKIR